MYALPTSTYIGIGTSNPTTSLNLHNGILYLDGQTFSGQAGGGNWGRITIDTGVSTGHAFLSCFNNNGMQFYLGASGNFYCNSIQTSSIIVKADVDFPDYVFSENYSLRNLNEVENFIKVNKHLPNVPSAKEIKEEGLNLIEMNKVLLEKVEELTLYLINIEKNSIELKNKIINLENQLNSK